MKDQKIKIEYYKAKLSERGGKMFLSLPFEETKRKYYHGSMTVEAAMTLPLVLIVLCAFLSLFFGIGLQVKLQSALDRVNQRISVIGYLANEVSDQSLLEKIDDVGRVENFLVGAVLSQTLVKAAVIDEMGGTFSAENVTVSGVNELYFAGSRYLPEQESVYLTATFLLRVPLIPEKVSSLSLSCSSTRRLWTGKPIEKGNDEQLVYITENGVVYHTHLNCTYLKLSIKEIDVNQIGGKRNSSGKKYSSCEICGDGNGMSVYYTTYGDRYHYNRNCSGLKRTINSVPYSDRGDLPLCSKCKKVDDQENKK